MVDNYHYMDAKLSVVSPLGWIIFAGQHTRENII